MAKKSSLERFKEGRTYYVSFASKKSAIDMGMSNSFEEAKAQMAAFAMQRKVKQVTLMLGKNIMDDMPDSYEFKISITLTEVKEPK